MGCMNHSTETGAVELPTSRSCFVCGQENPIGLKLRFWKEGMRVCSKFRPSPFHVGFLTVVHGGVVATVLDEAMAWACAALMGRFSFCAELVVRYLRPVRPGVEYTVFGEITKELKGKIYEAQARLESGDGQLMARATGKYVPVPDEQLKEMAADLLGLWP